MELVSCFWSCEAERSFLSFQPFVTTQLAECSGYTLATNDGSHVKHSSSLQLDTKKSTAC